MMSSLIPHRPRPATQCPVDHVAVLAHVAVVHVGVERDLGRGAHVAIICLDAIARALVAVLHPLMRGAARLILALLYLKTEVNTLPTCILVVRDANRMPWFAQYDVLRGRDLMLVRG
jgi:hypothetical protein